MLLSSFPRSGTIILFSLLTFFALCAYNAERLGLRHPPPPPPPPEPSPKYKPTPTPRPEVVENFPSAASATSPADLPLVPSWNRPKKDDASAVSSSSSSSSAPTSAPAPLLIGFTRNWPILQQAVVSYIAAGWPASSIYVIDNTGTMDANARGQLTLQNPFYLDHARLTGVFGVNVVRTPTYLTFAQLQNFMMSLALENEWRDYFWSHMDVAVLADERWTMPDKHDSSTGRYASLFTRAVNKRDELVAWQKAEMASEAEKAATAAATGAEGELERRTGGEGGGESVWACHYFAYDRLTLVNLQAYMEVGGWDPMIGYYLGDCDFYERLRMKGYRMDSGDIGLIADVGTTLDDLGVLFRRKGWPVATEGHEMMNMMTTTRGASGGGDGDDGLFGVEDERGGEGYERLRETILELERRKLEGGGDGRNFWQAQQQGGRGEPFYRDPDGFEKALWMQIEAGKRVFEEKWGHRGCDLRAVRLGPDDAWKVEHDWD